MSELKLQVPTQLVIGATPISGGVAGGVLFDSGPGTLQESTKLTFDGNTLTIAAGTITTALAPLAITETRNASGITFPGVTITITDTASASGSKALQILGGSSASTSLFFVRKDGNASFGGSQFDFQNEPSHSGRSYWNATVGWNMGSGLVYGISPNTDGGLAAQDTAWSRLAAGVWGAGTGSAGSFAGRVKLTSAIAAGVAVGSLNASPTTGEIQSVTDALAPVIGNAVASGGSAKALVWYNGGSWTVIGV